MRHRKYAAFYHVIEWLLVSVGLGWSLYWLLHPEPEYHLSHG